MALGYSAKQRANAWERLDVTPEQVQGVPQISHLFKKIGQETRWKPHLVEDEDGRQQSCRGCKECQKGYLRVMVNKPWKTAVIDYLRGSSEDDARQWLAVWDTLSKTAQDALPLEAICIAATLTTKRLFELVSGAMFEQSAAESSLIAAVAHPQIVQATIDSALQPEGIEDRKMLHQHRNFLPVPKNNIVNVRGNQIIDNSQGKTLNINPPAVADTVRSLSDKFNARFLTAEPVAVLALGPGDEQKDDQERP